MLKIVILGGSGFIGKNLTEFFREKKGYELFVPTKKEVDVLDKEKVERYLKKYLPDIIIHAAIHNPGKDRTKDASKILEYDLRMFHNLACYSELYGKMLYIGSGAEYDKSSDIIQVNEEEIEKKIPLSPYGLAKYTINQLIRKSDNIYNMRVFGLYGPYENWKTTFISGACCKAVKEIPLSIRQNVLFDYMWIEDFERIVEWFVRNTPLYHDYNVVSGKPIDLLSVANMVNEISKKHLPIFVCKEGMANEYTASNTRLVAEMGEIPFTEHRTAINKLYQWYVCHQEVIELYPLLYQ